jgi:hypothetical protein
MTGVDEVTGLEPVGVGTPITGVLLDVGTSGVGVADGVSEAVSAGGVYVGLPGPQTNPMLPIPRSQSSCSLSSGSSNPTDVAPPHWSLVTSVPAEEHRAFFLQVEPSGMPKEMTTSASTEVKRWNLSMEKPALS